MNAFRVFDWGSWRLLVESIGKISSNATRRLREAKIDDIMRHWT